MFEFYHAIVAFPAGGGGQGGSGGLLEMLLPLGIMGAIFYFLVLRPQQKRQKELDSLLAGLKTGDEVVTTGGLVGKISKVEGDVFTIDMGERTKVRILRAHITGLRGAPSESKES